MAIALKKHLSPINSLAFMRDGQTLIGTEEQQGIILWDFELDKLLVKGGDRLSNYLHTNPNLQQSERQICPR